MRGEGQEVAAGLMPSTSDLQAGCKPGRRIVSEERDTTILRVELPRCIACSLVMAFAAEWVAAEVDGEVQAALEAAATVDAAWVVRCKSWLPPLRVSTWHFASTLFD